MEKGFEQTFVLPVNETKEILASLEMASPISAPPQTVVKMAPGRLFFSNTSTIIFVVAIVTKDVVGAPFLEKKITKKNESRMFG